MDAIFPMSTYLLSDCKQFLAKYNFYRTIDTAETVVIENEFCSICFEAGSVNDFHARYRNKKTAYQFELQEIIEFNFCPSERRIFNTFFYKNLVHNKAFPLVTKLMLDFLDTNKPQVFTGADDWSAQLIADLELKKMQVDYVFKSFFHGHPIKRQFYEGDPSWRTNLEAYLRENNISLTPGPKSSITQYIHRWSRVFTPSKRKEN